jgi:thiamine-phosphate pyrophosphorylase
LPKQKKPIYALCDRQMLDKAGICLSDYISMISKYDIVYIQYRDKLNNILVQKEAITTIKFLTDIPVIINDKLELLGLADGIHLGQEDLELLADTKSLAINSIREKYPNKIIGISTHNPKEILEINQLDIDYIGLGAYRDTSTKKDISNIIGDSASEYASLSNHPVGLIGGVKIDDDVEFVSYNVIGSGLLN